MRIVVLLADARHDVRRRSRSRAERSPRRSRAARRSAGAKPGVDASSVVKKYAARRSRRVERQGHGAAVLGVRRGHRSAARCSSSRGSNLIAAVMGMVGSFLGISAVYMMLYAHFLAVIQMLVYAGAIMVLFVFVIMILNRPEDEPVAPIGRVGPGASAALAILYLVGRLVMLLIHVKLPNAAIAIAPPGVTLPPISRHVRRAGRLGLGRRRSAPTCSVRACSRSRRSRSCCSSPWSARSRSRGRSRG